MRYRIFCATVSVLAVTLLSACGGGDDGPAAQTLGGTAAVGAPIVDGTVNVSCAGGSAISQTKATNASGNWTVTLSGQTFPCAVQVTGGNIGSETGPVNSISYHSIAFSLGTINVTPLTDLVVANLSGRAPGTWFSDLNSSALQAIQQDAVDTALDNVDTGLVLDLSKKLTGKNPLTTEFQAENGDPIDDILEALKNAGALYSSLLDLAQNATFSAPAGFNFANAYAALSSGTGGSTGSCATGEIATTYELQAASGPYTNGQKICFTATQSQLAFSGKTLTNPVANTAVAAPYSAYSFADGENVYEVIFNAGNLYEINLSVGGVFNGQFTPSSGSETGTGTDTGTGTGTDTGTGTSGNANLTLEVNASGVVSTINVGNVPKPASEADFCGEIQNDTNLAAIGTQSGGTLTINSCSYSGNVGNISATVSLTTPIAVSIPYSVVYTYN